MTSDTLFPIEETLSPKLAWMKKHSVSTRRNQYGGPEPWEAYVGDYTEAVEDVGANGETSIRMAYGDTEMDALANLAIQNGWLLWNEEGLA
jgi:hypothetical protein